jgi:hypothetical protein
MNSLNLQFLKELAQLATGFHLSAHRSDKASPWIPCFFSSVGKLVHRLAICQLLAVFALRLRHVTTFPALM